MGIRKELERIHLRKPMPPRIKPVQRKVPFPPLQVTPRNVHTRGHRSSLRGRHRERARIRKRVEHRGHTPTLSAAGYSFSNPRPVATLVKKQPRRKPIKKPDFQPAAPFLNHDRLRKRNPRRGCGVRNNRREFSTQFRSVLGKWLEIDRLNPDLRKPIKGSLGLLRPQEPSGCPPLINIEHCTNPVNIQKHPIDPVRGTAKRPKRLRSPGTNQSRPTLQSLLQKPGK